MLCEKKQGSEEFGSVVPWVAPVVLLPIRMVNFNANGMVLERKGRLRLSPDAYQAHENPTTLVYSQYSVLLREPFGPDLSETLGRKLKLHLPRPVLQIILHLDIDGLTLALPLTLTTDIDN